MTAHTKILVSHAHRFILKDESCVRAQKWEYELTPYDLPSNPCIKLSTLSLFAGVVQGHAMAGLDAGQGESQKVQLLKYILPNEVAWPTR